ncbi:MAG: hypothetical protein UFP03_00575 [Paludibacteraceae bacterium]|jgi:hypothetical protein|nr:hypothetical protein [Paludibacteraceae bacterium]
MKNKWFILLLFFSLSMAVGAVSLPNQSYSVYNELYETNKDFVSMSYGTVFRGINTRIVAQNTSWGTECSEGGDVKGMDCRKCCREHLEELGDETADEEYNKLADECLAACEPDGNVPLGGAPLDLPVWFILPLCGLYGAVQRIRNRKKEAE